MTEATEAPPSDAEIVVIGAGITGLTTTHLLHAKGHNVLLLEARDELGGRIRSASSDTDDEYLGDLGPTWVWPDYQPVVAHWLAELDVETFAQFDSGSSVIEMNRDQAPTVAFLPGQVGSLRIKGGTSALIDRLAATLPSSIVRTSSPVRDISIGNHSIALTLRDAEETIINAGKIVVATPPRIAATTINWSPSLPSRLHTALSGMATWMAPHAKTVITYDTPFWRARGLSGRIASRVGPLGEVHDHCSHDGGQAALFGFFAWPHDRRRSLGSNCEDRVIEQLVRCFGAAAGHPTSIRIMDWANDPYVATPLDLASPMTHPTIGPDIIRQSLSDDRVWFAAAETAMQSPGLIEGALIAAEHVTQAIGDP